jgi:hypothetical protein
MVVATIIAAYHQTNDEYLTGSFNERNIVTYKGALSLSLTHTHSLVLMTLRDATRVDEVVDNFFFHLSFDRVYFLYIINHAATFY